MPVQYMSGEPFVGRLAELEKLRTIRADIALGGGRFVLVTGEAGVGKTAFMQHFAADWVTSGAIALWTACFEGEWQPPYAVWGDALEQLIGELGDDQLRSWIGSGAPVLAQLTPGLRQRLPTIGQAADLPPDQARYRLGESIARFLIAVADTRPILLVVDDLQWAGQDTMEALRYVARSVRSGRVLIVAIYRESEVAPAQRKALQSTLASLQREVSPASLLLSGLTLDEVNRYLEQMAAQPLPQALVRAFHEQTAGNPFFIRELFRHLVEETRITHRAGRWTTDFSIGELGIPPAVNQVVARRLDRLSAATDKLLQVASAFAAGFEFALLPPLTDLSEETLLDCLDEALQAGLIRTLDGQPPRYGFAHSIVRHTLYERLNPERRARLHRRIAQVLELMPGNHAAAELGFQYFASAALPGSERGIGHCLVAAELAATQYAYDQQVTLLHMARDLAHSATLPQRADIACRQAIAEASALRLTDAWHTGEHALALLNQSGAAPQDVVAFCVALAYALKDGGAPPREWSPFVDHGLALIGDERDLSWARLMLLKGRVEVVSSQELYISRWAGHEALAVALARAHGDEGDHARTLEPLDWRTPEQTAAVIDLARRWQRPVAVLRAHDVAIRDLIFRQGAIPAAKEHLAEFLRAGERFGSIPAQAEAMVQLALCEALLGNWEAAERARLQADHLVARLGSSHRLHVLAALTIEFVMGDHRAVDWSHLAQHFTRVATDPQTGLSAMGLTAANSAVFTQLRAGNLAEARRLLALLTPVLERLPLTTYLFNGGVDRGGTVVWELRAVDDAPRYRALAMRLLEADIAGSPYRSNALTVARMAALRGDLAEATAYFAHARRAAEEAGQRPLRAIVDYDEALALTIDRPGDAARAGALFTSALAQFRALRMQPWEQRVLSHIGMTAAAPDFPHSLTPREVEVLRLIAQGATNREVAAQLVVSLATAERHVANIYNKIGTRNRAEAVAFAHQHGLLLS